jgi:hypothetical protein
MVRLKRRKDLQLVMEGTENKEIRVGTWLKIAKNFTLVRRKHRPSPKALWRTNSKGQAVSLPILLPGGEGWLDLVGLGWTGLDGLE